MDNKVKIAVVGLGGRGLYFLRTYSQDNLSEVVAVCDIDEKKLSKLKSVHGEKLKYYTDIEKMIGEVEIDGVIVATDDPHHTEPAVKALNHDKNVFLEKPVAQTLEDCKKIIEAAKKSKGIFMVGYELRHCTLFQDMKKFIDEGKIGRVIIGIGLDNVSVGGNYFFHGKGRRKEYYKSLLLQKASHSIDLLNWFMGSRPVRVYASGGLDVFGGDEPNDKRCRDCEKKETCPYFVDYKRFVLDYGEEVSIEDGCVYAKEVTLGDNSQLLIEYENGKRATFTECHFTPEYSREFTLIGDKGKMYGFYNNEGHFNIRISYRHSYHIDEYHPPHPGGGHGGGDPAIKKKFIENIITGKKDKENLESAYYSTAVGICAEKSIETGKVIEIPEMEE